MPIENRRSYNPVFFFLEFIRTFTTKQLNSADINKISK
jgi:hypothetical protein